MQSLSCGMELAAGPSSLRGVSSGLGSCAGAMTRGLPQAPGHHLGQTVPLRPLQLPTPHTFPLLSLAFLTTSL